jgi:uncharacterized protein (DUF2141 family)
MNRYVLSYFVFFILIVFFATSCANISAPSGGQKDVTPPVVVKDVPANGSADFTGNNFVVTFDEYIVLDKITEKFMVSPPLNKNPVISAKGKSLAVGFDEKLKDSTTYTFYFQDAIRDLNEGNPINNYQFVFSTGPVVDSLSVTGNVFNAPDLESDDGFLVLMHRELADSAPRIKLPTYITKTDKTGSFRINNVKPGEYKLYALGDKNNNKKYDLKDEPFAFMDSVIEVNVSRNYISGLKDSVKPKAIASKETTPVPTVGEFKLLSFTAPKKDQYLTSSYRKQPYSLIYTFALPLDTAKFSFFIPGTTPGSYFIEENISRDTIKIWITDSTLYSSERIESIIKYPNTDTTGMLIDKTDTIPMRFMESKPLKGKRNPKKLSYTLNLQGNTLKPEEKIVIKTTSPFREPDTSRIALFEAKDTILIKIPYSMVKDRANSCKYVLDARLKENGKYLLILDSAALGDLYGNVSDSVGIKFSVRMKETFGSLTINLSGYDKELIVQLLDNSEKLIKQINRKGAGKVVFPLVEVGKYRLKVIYDLDSDGKWTTGDYDILRQPEPVSYYPDEINIKANWELQQDWDVSIRNFKNQSLRKKAAGS